MDEQVEGKCFCCGAGPQVTAMAKSVMPNQAWEHFRASRLELLKGFRQLLDARIQQLSKPKPMGSTIPVD